MGPRFVVQGQKRAGRQLAETLAGMTFHDPVLLALPVAVYLLVSK